MNSILPPASYGEHITAHKHRDGDDEREVPGWCGEADWASLPTAPVVRHPIDPLPEREPVPAMDFGPLPPRRQNRFFQDQECGVCLIGVFSNLEEGWESLLESELALESSCYTPHTA